MSCGQFNFNVTVGCSIIYYLNVNNYNGTPINLSGYSCRGLVLNMPGDTGNYIYNLNPQPVQPYSSGIILVSGGASTTTGLLPGSYLYDIEIYSSGDFAIKILNGDFNVQSSTSY